MNLLPTDYHLQLVTDHSIIPLEQLPSVIELLIQGGVNVVQLRDKKANTRDLISVGKKLKQQLAPYRVPLLVNDRLDVALAIDADGVHLGQSDMPYETARQLLGNNKIIGITINNLEQAQQAQSWDVDYFGVGPIFPTSTKPDATKPMGLEGLAAIRRLVSQPLIAIGGIRRDNVASLYSAGANGVAVVSALLATKDVTLATQQFKEALLCPSDTIEH